jgi:hypothetical protein
MGHLFWLSDETWMAIEPQLSKNPAGCSALDDRRVISGILHVLKSNCRWRDCPSVLGRAPQSTIASVADRYGASGSKSSVDICVADELIEAAGVVSKTSDACYDKLALNSCWPSSSPPSLPLLGLQ